MFICKTLVGLVLMKRSSQNLRLAETGPCWVNVFVLSENVALHEFKLLHSVLICICCAFIDHDEHNDTVNYVVIDELQEKFGPAVSLAVLSFYFPSTLFPKLFCK